ncbi:hypothetical protein Avbf_09011 [Armadillidium vulgare]|nr:hypothetical protein Avbf_09011 [Armadillidium vulgare]
MPNQVEVKLRNQSFVQMCELRISLDSLWIIFI